VESEISQIIYRRETNAREEWIAVNDDETVTHHIENSGWPMMKAGIGGRDRTMTTAAAKKEWPNHVEAFKKALTTISETRSK
jgi:hypothetical protein